jgi:hypothetical protein
MDVWHVKKVHQLAFKICSGLLKVLRGCEGTLWPDFLVNTLSLVFLNSQFHHKIREGGCKEIQYRDNEACIQQGQESPLIKKKG